MPVIEVISKMTASRAGAVVIVNSAGELDGIFTQGDFARSFQNGDPDIGKQPVASVMTSKPIHVLNTQLVGEVLRILEDNRIDDLIVVDEQGFPCGMIDTQDLTKVQVL
jgi:arabinose-5-phosphate isomerase